MKAHRYIVTVHRSLALVETEAEQRDPVSGVPLPVPMETMPEAELWLSIAVVDGSNMLDGAVRLDACLAALAEASRLLKQQTSPASPVVVTYRPRTPSRS